MKSSFGHSSKIRFHSHLPGNVSLREKLQASWQKLAESPPPFAQILASEDIWALAKEQGLKARENFQHLVILGSGGSSIGTQVIVDSCRFKSDSSKRIFFLDNVDPHQTADIFSQIDLPKTLFFTVSKSGKTMETLSSLSACLDLLKTHGLDPQKHIWIVTDPNQNPLGQWATKNSLKTLPIPPQIGGRFSVLTAVGLIPAAFLGLDLERMKIGASSFDRDFILHFAEQALLSFERQEWISFFWCYSWRLKNFGLWLNQLWAESLAKAANRDGGPPARVSSPFWALGTQDQHSLLQQVMEGSKDKFVVFMRLLEAEAESGFVVTQAMEPLQYLNGKSLGQVLAAEAQATEQALQQNGISTARVEIDSFDEEVLATLFMNFQWITALLAEQLNLNAYDQPGVELGKNIARELLASRQC